MMTVGVVVPTLSNTVGLAKFLASMSSTKFHWQLIFIPNWIEGNCVAKSWNIGMQKAKMYGCRYVLISNDDIVLAPGSFEAMVLDLMTNKDVAMTSGLNLRDHGIGGEEAIWSYKSNDDGIYNTDFSCFMVRPSIVDEVGTFDENFTPAYFEDNDFAYRMKLLGLKHRSIGRAPMFHAGSQTQNKDPYNPACPSWRFTANHDYYIMKWGGSPDMEGYKNPYGNEGMSPKEWIKDFPQKT